MKALVLMSTMVLAACASTQSFTSHNPVPETRPVSTAGSSQALLLLSLADGQLVLQEIDIDADVCMKSNTAPATRCFTRGAPIYAEDATTIIAYEAVTRDLDLHAAQ